MQYAAVETLRGTIDPRAAATLDRIVTPERRLLALRSYLRAGSQLGARWSWTAAEVAAYESSAEYTAALAEIDKVVRAFARANPGYRLYVDTQVRTLETQLSRWNDSDGVAAVAADLARDAARAGIRGASELRAFLVQWRPRVAAPLAAPGLSAHGQMRAFDFQVMSGNRLIAGPRIASIARDWDEAGWTDKLRLAVQTASTRFEGPLASPREPWHYTYRP